jgi:hypothetical protein
VGYVVSGIGGASLLLSFLLLREKKDLPPLDWRDALSLENIMAVRRTAALSMCRRGARTWAQAQRTQVSPVCRPEVGVDSETRVMYVADVRKVVEVRFSRTRTSDLSFQQARLTHSCRVPANSCVVSDCSSRVRLLSETQNFNDLGRCAMQASGRQRL